MSTRHTVADTSLGPLTIVAADEQLVGLYFHHHIRRPDNTTFGHLTDADPLLDEATQQIAAYLAGLRHHFNLPLAPIGNDFQRAVWAAIGDVAYGDTTTYGQIAQQLGDARMAWTVGQAVGANPLCLLIACHRVVGANGALTGYAGGLKHKRTLLDMEAQFGTAPHLPLE